MLPLPERITVWKRANTDGLGGSSWSAPAVWPARIAYSQRRFTDINGDDATSTAVCYAQAPVTRQEVQQGVYVLFGESTAVNPPDDANDVRALSYTPSGAGELRKFWFA